MSSVAEVLRSKNIQETYFVTPDNTVYEAISLMSTKGIGALVVLEGDKLAGLFSERDYTRKIALMDRSSKTTKVAEIMTSQLITVTPAHTVDQCLALMTDKHIRHLPVLEDNKLVGMLSIGDLVKKVMEDQQKLIEQLHQYISS